MRGPNPYPNPNSGEHRHVHWDGIGGSAAVVCIIHK